MNVIISVETTCMCIIGDMMKYFVRKCFPFVVSCYHEKLFCCGGINFKTRGKKGWVGNDCL